MTNYEAILRMTPEQLAAFLDDVMLTGIQTGLYAAGLRGDAQGAVLGETPFDGAWLSRDAEGATRTEVDLNGDLMLSAALARATFRLAGIEEADL